MLHVTKSKQLLGLRELGRLGIKASLVAGSLLLAGASSAQEFRVGEPIG